MALSPVEPPDNWTLTRVYIAAVRLYLTFCRVPGADAYGVFQPALVLTSLSVLRRLFGHCVTAKVVDDDTMAMGIDGSGSKRTQKAARDSDSDESVHGEDDGAMDAHLLAPSELRIAVAGALGDVRDLVRGVSLLRHSGARAQAIDLCARVLRAAHSHDVVAAALPERLSVAAANTWCGEVAAAAGDALAAMADAKIHGESAALTAGRHMMRELLDALMAPASSAGRRRALAVVVSLAESATSDGSSKRMEAVLALLQHVCVSAKDKADARSSAIGVLQAVLAPMPATQVCAFAKFLGSMSRNRRVAFRVFATEAISTLLSAKGSTSPDVWSVPAELARVSSADSAAERSDDSMQDEEKTGDATPATDGLQASGPVVPAMLMLDALMKRCGDKLPTVRCKAITGVSSVIEAQPAAVAQLDATMAEAMEKSGDVPLGASSLGSSLSTEPDSLETDATASPVAGNKRGAARKAPIMQAMLVRRLADAKSGVRKCALAALASLAVVPSLDGSRGALDETSLRLMVMRCGDEAISVRKAAIAALNRLVAENGAVGTVTGSMWLAGVIPLVSDAESGVAGAAMAAIDEHIFNDVASWRAADGAGSTVWTLLGGLSQHPEMVRSLRRHVMLRVRNKEMRKDLFKPLVAAAAASASAGSADVRGMAQRAGSWVVLEALASEGCLPPKAKIAFAVDSWRATVDKIIPVQAAADDPESLAAAASESAAKDACRMLRVLAVMANRVPAEEAGRLADEMLDGLQAFVWPANLVSATIEALTRISVSKAPSQEEGTAITQAWAGQLLAACEPALRQFAFASPEEAAELSSAGCAARLFVVGSLAVLGLADAERAKDKESAAHHKLLPIPQVMIPTTVVTLVQTLVAPSLQLHASAIEADESVGAGGRSTAAVTVPSEVRAHAFTALGKLCLRDEGLAKRCVTMFVRELETGESPVAVRNNVLFVLGDLCVKYTALVDRYVPAMASCVRDSSPLMRRHAVMLLTQLLVQEYVKWRGVLFFRFIAALADPDSDVRSFAEGALSSVLMLKAPQLLTSHFVEAMVVLQGCVEHPVYARVSAADDAAFARVDGGARAGGRIPLSLAGSGANARKRMHIYRTLLRHMSDEQRFTVAARLTQDVLGAVVDGTLPLPTARAAAADGASTPTHAATAAMAMATPKNDIHGPGDDGVGTVAGLIAETFAVLSCKEIQVNFKGRGADDDEGSAAAAAVAVARGRMMSRLARKNTLENTVPTIVALKHVLQKARSPLLGALMRYTKQLFTTYRDDLTELLTADRTLANEIEFDLRMFDEQQAAIKAAARASAKAMAAAAAAVADASGAAEADEDDGGAGAGAGAAVSTPGPRTPAPLSVTKRKLSAIASPPGSLPRVASAGTPVTPRRAGETPSRGAMAAVAALSGDITPSTAAAMTPKVRRTPSSASANGVVRTPSAAPPAPPAPMASPLPTSLPIRVYADDDVAAAAAAKGPVIVDANATSNTIFMPSPTAPVPKPREWGVSAPEPEAGSSTDVPDVDADDDIAPAAENDPAASSGKSPDAPKQAKRARRAAAGGAGGEKVVAQQKLPARATRRSARTRSRR